MAHHFPSYGHGQIAGKGYVMCACVCVSNLFEMPRKSYGDQLNFVRKFPQLSQTFAESNFGFSSFQNVSKNENKLLGKFPSTFTPKNSGFPLPQKVVRIPECFPGTSDHQGATSPIKITISPSHGTDVTQTLEGSPTHCGFGAGP